MSQSEEQVETRAQRIARLRALRAARPGTYEREVKAGRVPPEEQAVIEGTKAK